MTREDINDIINAICPNDEDYEKPCISPKYLRQELEQLALDQRQWNGEPITKNDLGVDCISRADARSLICKIDRKYMFNMSGKAFQDLYKGIDDLPSVTPQLSVPEVTALAEWTEKLTKASEDAYNKGYEAGMKAQEPILDRLRERVELEKLGYPPSAGYYKAIMKVLEILDKYKAESEKA